MRRSRLLTASIVVVVLLAASAGAVSVQACREPVDVSGSLARSSWLDAVKQYDGFWYRSHVVVGTLLADAGCSPLATGLQWLKAGAHARTEQDVEMVGRGLAAARTRADHAPTFDTWLCQYLAGDFTRSQQQAAAHLAGLDCS